MPGNIMILGIGPLAMENPTRFHGGGNRAWHLTAPLLENDFAVTLICMRVTNPDQSTLPEEECRIRENLTYYSVDEIRCFASDEYLQKKIAEHRPDAIVGACDYPAARAAAVAGNLPFWADIHGYPMGEAQAKAFHYREPGYVHHFWNLHRPVLYRGDRFSVTSERQKMATIGELGAMGRLNPYTFGETLVTQIPIAWDDQTLFQKRQRRKEDPFLVFFSGGYNLWCDVDTLFKALELAMEADSRIRFLSTGGAIAGHDEKTFPRFRCMVKQSRFRERYDLRGWVDREELQRCQHEAHLAINVDLPCYETIIGARNRITESMALGIPILTTLGTEISQILFYKGLILAVPIQDPQALANEMILAANHPEKMDKMAEQARRLFECQYNYRHTVGDFLAWCRAPSHSGDFGKPPLILDYRRPGMESSPSESAKRGFWQKLKKL